MSLPLRPIVACLAVALICLGTPSPAGGVEVSIEAAARTVKAYERIEFTLRTDAVPANPYDPEAIDLRVALKGPDGTKVTVPAFWYQPFEYARHRHGGGAADWVYPAGDAVWKARFATPAPGRWTATARLTTPRGEATSKPVTFTCTAAPGHGYVRVSPRDPRFLEFSDGTPFFAVGQNVAFIKDTERQSAMIRRLGANGANFVRVWACCEDWAMAVEARKSGWARSWGWRPPIVAEPGRAGYHRAAMCIGRDLQKGAALSFSATRPLAVRPGTEYVLTGKARTDSDGAFVVAVAGTSSDPIRSGKRWTGFTHPFRTDAGRRFLGGVTFRAEDPCRLYLKDLSLREAGGGPELLWEADVNRPPLGVYNQADAFILDRVVETAEDAGVYLQIVMCTRDHYMHLLDKDPSPEYARAVAMAKRLVRYFVARWGWSTHVAVWEYFNEMNPGLPTERFYSEVGAYLEEIDPWHHLRATSDWHSPSKAAKHPALDTADMHYYMRPTTGDDYRDAAASVLKQARAFRRAAPKKPAIFSEFGMTTDNWQRPEAIDLDKDFLHLHNALWASALSGLSSTVCHWYWDDIHKRNVYPLYRPVAAFVADIPFTTADLRPADATTTAKDVRVVGLQGKRQAYLWLSDLSSTWWNVARMGRNPARVRDAAVKVTGLASGPYRVRWWDTRAGKVVREATARAAGNVLTVPAPAFTGDVAVKVEPAPP
ncbi:MAG: DUF5060 domain-containing protein [Phycisphaerae bacterium]